MRAEHQVRDRVGVRVVLVAAATALLVLMLHGPAYSQEPTGLSAEVARALLVREPLDVDARVDEAQGLLREKNRERLGEVGSAAVELGWKAAISPSPRRLFRGARRMAKALLAWRERSDAEDRALELIESDIVAGTDSVRAQELYARLRARELDEQIENWLDEADDALERDDLEAAGRWLTRARTRHARAEGLDRLADRLAERERARPDELTDSLSARVAPWEAELCASLLVDQTDRVLTLGGGRSDARLAHAAAHYTAGREHEGFQALRGLEAEAGAAGELARRWLADPSLRPDGADAPSSTESRLRNALGVLGGERLQRRGLELSADAYDAWKQALAPLNLALSVPQRLLHGADAPPSELELLAADRLASGHGSLSHEAADLLADVRRRSGAGSPDPRGWDDGFFVLPPAQTDYKSIHLSPILVTELALRGVTREELGRSGVDLHVPSGLLLRAHEGEVGEAEISFTRAQGLALTAALATGLESAALRPLETPESELFVALRRLDQRLRDGSTLVVDPWTPSDDALAATTSHSIFEHTGTHRMQQVSIERDRDSVAVRRELVGHGQYCPDEALCIDRDRAVTGNVYAVLEDDGSFRIGAHTRFDQVHFGLEMGSSGPRVSMTLPVGRWLGLGRWLPIEASFAASAEGIDAAPRMGERSTPEFSAAR